MKNKPWQWWLGILPGLASVAFTAIGKLFPKGDQIGWSIIGLFVGAFLCLGVAAFLTRNVGHPGKMIGFGFLLLIPIVIVNFSIALGGCIVLEPYFRIQ